VLTGTDWQVRFANRLMSLDEAVALVRSGDRVMGGLPEPAPFLQRLAARDDLRDVELFLGAPRVGGVAVARHPGIRVRAAFVTQAFRQAGVEVDVLPVGFHGWIGYIRRWAPRVRVVLVGEPDEEGRVPPGGSVAADDELVQGTVGRPSDAVVIGLVDRNQPHIRGHAFHVDDFDALVALPDNVEPPRYDERKISPFLETFVAMLDELIPDGATVQAGVGGIPDQAMRHLTFKRDLGIHTEVLGGGLADLWRSGAVTNARKTHYQGRSLFTIALPEAWEQAAASPQSCIERAAAVLDPREIARNRLMRCVNATLQVDLYGQGNAEMIAGVQYSGVGGQVDFHRGCNLGDDALSILTLESTAAGGTVSRIVPHLAPNAVTSTRHDAHVVITEHGIAWLRDCTVAQRAARLIAVAHPDFRAELTEEAERAGLL
jgi:4-hydroxybutyrate CoA-transferase